MATSVGRPLRTPTVKLSSVKPDFESILMQLQIGLLQRATWKDLLPSSVGETFLEFMASVAAYNQFGVELAAREGFLHTARRDSSIYAIARMLGVRVPRKFPASVPVTLTRSRNLEVQEVIPRFTQFEVNGFKFFNRTPIAFPVNADKAATVLYDGELKTQKFKADSSEFRELYLNEGAFNVSDVDVDVEIVRADGLRQKWVPTEEGLWIHGRENVYVDMTSGTGDVILTFGDNMHGAAPQLGSEIIVRYAVTRGRAANGSATGLRVETPFVHVEGVTTAVTAGGADEKPAYFFKALAPHIFRARRRAVTDLDYPATLSLRPNISSAVIQTQREIAPWDLRWMNHIRVCALPMEENQDALTENEWSDLFDFMQRRKGAQVVLVPHNPTKEDVDLRIMLVMNIDVAPADVLPKVEANVRQLFGRRHDTLGRRISISDIMAACKVEGVDYTLLDTLDDFVPRDKLSYIKLRNLQISTRYTERNLMGGV